LSVRLACRAGQLLAVDRIVGQKPEG